MWSWKAIISVCIEFSWSEAVVHFLSNDPLFFMHSLIFFMHSFIHCILLWVGSTWFDPTPQPPPALSRLGGALWGRLLPPSLPSPLPFPGRGTTDLKGLSTEVLPPALPPPVSRAATTGWWNSPSSWPPHPSTALCLSPSVVVLVIFSFASVPCLHACTSVPLLQFSSQKLLPADRRAALNRGPLLWLLVPSQVEVVVTS